MMVELANKAHQMTETANSSAQDIKNIFDRIAPVYDQLNDRLSLGQHRIWKQMAVKWSEAKPGDHGLDVCCGSGDLALRLAKQIGHSGRVTGLDFSPEQLAIARQKHQHQDPSLPISWQEGDALALPFSNNQFDCATMGYGLRNVTDIPQSLRELYRVLKPRAKAAILDFHRPKPGIGSAIQQWYLANIVVPAADSLGMKDEYAYINPSIDKFPTGAEQIKLSYEVGFSQAVHYPLIGGMMGILVIAK